LDHEHFIEKQNKLKMISEVTMFLNQWTTNLKLDFKFLDSIFNGVGVSIKSEQMRGVFKIATSNLDKEKLELLSVIKASEFNKMFNFEGGSDFAQLKR
jgi:hypothetical protein